MKPAIYFRLGLSIGRREFLIELIWPLAVNASCCFCHGVLWRQLDLGPTMSNYISSLASEILTAAGIFINSSVSKCLFLGMTRSCNC